MNEARLDSVSGFCGCAACREEQAAPPPVMRFVVRYFDAKAGRQNRAGVQEKRFVERGEAETFAAGRKLYAKPASVRVLDMFELVAADGTLLAVDTELGCQAAVLPHFGRKALFGDDGEVFVCGGDGERVTVATIREGGQS